jgi:HAMP domain-containing protein
VEVVVPTTDYTEHVDAEARIAFGLGVLALILAVAGGVTLARWIARPLHELARHARRIRHGDLDVTVVPRSRDEIGVLARAMGDMVQALRDRDFIRETFGRYVTPELAEQCLRDRDALQLGGEVREVAMLMSDLRGFSELSERLGAPAMIALLNEYLAKARRSSGTAARSASSSATRSSSSSARRSDARRRGRAIAATRCKKRFARIQCRAGAWADRAGHGLHVRRWSPATSAAPSASSTASSDPRSTWSRASRR